MTLIFSTQSNAMACLAALLAKMRVAHMKQINGEFHVVTHD